MNPFELSISLGHGVPSRTAVTEKFFKLIEAAPASDSRAWPQTRWSGYSPDGTQMLAAGMRFTRGFVDSTAWRECSAKLVTELSGVGFESIFWSSPYHGGSAELSPTFLCENRANARLPLVLDVFAVIPLVTPIPTAEFAFHEAAGALAARAPVFLDAGSQAYSAESQWFRWPAPVGSQSEPFLHFTQGERLDLLADLVRNRDERTFRNLVSEWRAQKVAARRARETAKTLEGKLQALKTQHGFAMPTGDEA